MRVRVHCERSSRLLSAVAEEGGTALGFLPAAISAVPSDPTVNSCCILLPQTDQRNDNDSTARLVSIHPTLGHPGHRSVRHPPPRHTGWMHSACNLY